jgi:hypothetical protein
MFIITIIMGHGHKGVTVCRKKSAGRGTEKGDGTVV